MSIRPTDYTDEVWTGMRLGLKGLLDMADPELALRTSAAQDLDTIEIADILGIYEAQGHTIDPFSFKLAVWMMQGKAVQLVEIGMRAGMFDQSLVREGVPHISLVPMTGAALTLADAVDRLVESRS